MLHVHGLAPHRFGTHGAWGHHEFEQWCVSSLHAAVPTQWRVGRDEYGSQKQKYIGLRAFPTRGGIIELYNLIEFMTQRKNIFQQWGPKHVAKSINSKRWDFFFWHASVNRRLHHRGQWASALAHRRRSRRGCVVVVDHMNHHSTEAADEEVDRGKGERLS
jgi:hypothetical protein